MINQIDWVFEQLSLHLTDENINQRCEEIKNILTAQTNQTHLD